MPPSKYVVAVDIGTTTIRACLFDEKCRLQCLSEQKVEITYGMVDNALRAEIDPEALWRQFHDTVTDVVSRVGPEAIASIGICCQRNTFICWDRKTQRPCHPFVTWKDCRASGACEQWNRSFRIRALHLFGTILFFLTRSNRFMGARMFSFISSMVTHRLLVTLEKNREMQKLLANGDLAFGCIDTWLINRMTGGQLPLTTEPSNASATGLFDPFTMKWGHSILNLINFPTQILPNVVDSADVENPIAISDPTIFGAAIPIGAVAADQQAALLGTGCLHKGQVKVSLGTGTFLDLNTADYVHASLKGLYPLVGWSIGKRPTFVAEAGSSDTAVALNWAHSIGLFHSFDQCSILANSVDDSGVFFVPAFGGLQAPINDDKACCAFIGLSPETSPAHMVRAILESFAFRVYQIWTVLLEEIDFPIVGAIRCCGGVSRNDFVCQTIATLLNRNVERLQEEHLASARGVALLAGITAGLWKETELGDFVQVQDIFEPKSDEAPRLRKTFDQWTRAVERCLRFY